MTVELKRHIDFIIHAHDAQAKSPEKRVRLWDKYTPYAIHPIWCATMIATETMLPEDVRTEGMLTLLYHDILEDTTASLPDSLSPEVRQSVIDMTFPGGTLKQEIFKIWDKTPKIRLFKLYDKVSNLLDSTWMPTDTRVAYCKYTQKLLDDVRQHYGELNIVKIGRALL